MRILSQVLSVLFLLSGIAFAQNDALKLMGRWPDGPCHAVAVDGNYAFINNGAALEILDISNPENFTSLSKLDLADIINSIRVSGSYAYVGGDHALYIIDISNKTLPKKTGTMPLSLAVSMVIKDNFLYAACPGRGFGIIDVKNPLEPKIASNSLFPYCFPTGVSIVDSLAYVCSWDSGLYVMNVKDKSAPVILAHYNFNNKYYPRDIYVKDSIAYVTSDERGSFPRYGRFQAFNIKNPLNIFEESGITLTGGWYAIGDKIALNGNYAYITSSTDSEDFIIVADISNPDSIHEVLKKHLEYSFDLSIKGKRLFVTAEHNGLLSFEISNPEVLVETGSFKTAGATGRVVRKGDYLYVANDQGGLKVLDISKPSNPSEVYSYKGSSQSERCNTVAVKDSLLFAGFSGGGYGLSIFSLDSSAPGLKKISESEPSDIMKIEAAGNYIYAARPHEILIYNVKDPYHLEKIFSDSTARDPDIAVNGSLLYLHEFLKGIKIFDVSNPANPDAIGYIPVWNVMNFCLSGSYLYASIYSDGIKIFDVSYPGNPREVGEIKDTGAYKIVVQDGFAYAFFNGRGLKVYNVENPALPFLARFYENFGTDTDMFIDKDYIILSEDPEGLTIYKNDIAALFGSREPQIKDFSLQQNYPNPFNPATTINYSIPEASFVDLRVFDILGREVASLVKKEQSVGKYNVQFDGSHLPSGIYIYSIRAGKFRHSRKMILIK